MSQLWMPWDPYGPFVYLVPIGGAAILLFGALAMLVAALRLMLARHLAGGLVIGLSTAGLNGVAVAVPFAWPVLDAIAWQIYAPIPGWWQGLWYPYVPIEWGLLWGGVGLAQLMFATGLMLVRRMPREPEE